MEPEDRTRYTSVRGGGEPETMTPQHTGDSHSTTDAEPAESRFVDQYGSVTSRAPLAQFPVPMAGTTDTYGRSSGFDAERAQGQAPVQRPGPHRYGSSWDLMGSMKKFEEEAAAFDPRTSSSKHLAFAEGDVPDTKITRIYFYLLSSSVITRWILFIIPILAILWIPGILSLTVFPRANILSVRLYWWSIWLSVVWGGWWGCLAVARVLPRIARHTVGLISVGSRKYIEWFAVLHRYVTLFGWSLAIQITFAPLITAQKEIGVTDSDSTDLGFIQKLLFGVWICVAILVAEKFAIQYIAGKFHEKSYAERIGEQKFAVRVLTVLYQNSRDIPGRDNQLGMSMKEAGASGLKLPDRKKILKKAFRGVRFAATSTTTALGNVASEMLGSSVLQPDSPQAKVNDAIHSLKRSQELARRLFFSFVEYDSHVILPRDIRRYFATAEDSERAFALFDADGNGDASKEEVENALLEIHREQLSIEHSMRDLDSAVGRLDNILISLYVFICFIVIAVVLDTQVVNLITGAGTLIVGLSWLIGGALTEVLTSIIFLFIKHPYDVGDRVSVDDTLYTVKEIRLLSTIFLDESGAYIQAPNAVISAGNITNIRRSGQMAETFKFDVAYDTTFNQLEQLRKKMLAYLMTEKRDFLPCFDVWVVDIPDQLKMSLKVDIKYKTNWQQAGATAMRRNKWVCKLKETMLLVGIWGPEGNPNPPPAGPAKYTQVPWEQVDATERRKEQEMAKKPPPPMEHMPARGWNLADRRDLNDSSSDVFDEGDDGLPSRQGTMGSTTTAAYATGIGMPAPSIMPVAQRTESPAPMPLSGMPSPSVGAPGAAPNMEYIEMRTPTTSTFPPRPGPGAAGASGSYSGYMEHRGA